MATATIENEPAEIVVSEEADQDIIVEDATDVVVSIETPPADIITSENETTIINREEVTEVLHEGQIGPQGPQGEQGPPGEGFEISPEGIAYFYDTTRDKNLSAERSNFNLAINHVKAKGKRYLSTIGGVPSNTSSYFIPRNATLTAVSAHADNLVTGSIKIEQLISGVPTVIHTISLTGEDDKFEDDLDIDFDAGHRMRAFIDSGSWNYPSLQIEIAWRF